MSAFTVAILPTPNPSAEVLDRVRATQPPLRGIVHAASTINDRLTADIDESDIEQVLRPKLDGALVLDELTRDDPIELFLLFSSATTILGAPGQGAYVAANMALETLARRRHAEGRPALAVAWGPIEDAGYLADRPEMRERVGAQARFKTDDGSASLGNAAGDAGKRAAVRRLRRNQLGRSKAPSSGTSDAAFLGDPTSK